jgi:hypothetical protein
MRALVTVGIIIVVCAIRADTPLPPPGKVNAMSPSGRVRAISDPKPGTSVEDVMQYKVLWSLPGWHRSLFGADDGKHLVTQYDGLNLLPTDFTDDLVLLTFWRQGSKIRDVRVRDFVPDQPTSGAHCFALSWGQRRRHQRARSLKS